MTSNKKQPKLPASHQRQIAINKARDEESKQLGGIQGFLGITRTEPKKSSDSEFEWVKRTFMDTGGGPKDIMKAVVGATKVVKKVVKKLNG